jgi:hypothetical protein
MRIFIKEEEEKNYTMLKIEEKDIIEELFYDASDCFLQVKIAKKSIEKAIESKEISDLVNDLHDITSMTQNDDDLKGYYILDQNTYDRDFIEFLIEYDNILDHDDLVDICYNTNLFISENNDTPIQNWDQLNKILADKLDLLEKDYEKDKDDHWSLLYPTEQVYYQWNGSDHERIVLKTEGAYDPDWIEVTDDDKFTIADEISNLNCGDRLEKIVQTKDGSHYRVVVSFYQSSIGEYWEEVKEIIFDNSTKLLYDSKIYDLEIVEYDDLSGDCTYIATCDDEKMKVWFSHHKGIQVKKI